MQRMTIATIGDEEQHVATISSTVHCYRLHLAVAVLGLILDCEGSTQVSDPVLHSQSTSYPLHSVLNRVHRNADGPFPMCNIRTDVVMIVL